MLLNCLATKFPVNYLIECNFVWLSDFPQPYGWIGRRDAELFDPPRQQTVPNLNYKPKPATKNIDTGDQIHGHIILTIFKLYCNDNT